jgi:hypothetical protein
LASLPPAIPVQVVIDKPLADRAQARSFAGSQRQADPQLIVHLTLYQLGIHGFITSRPQTVDRRQREKGKRSSVKGQALFGDCLVLGYRVLIADG